MAKTSKKNKPLREKLVEATSYNLEEALDILFEHKSEKFTESVDVSINLGVDPSKSDQNVRGASNLPHGTGRSYKVAVFAEGEEAQSALEAGADKVGMEDLADEMKSGQIDYDVIVATPDTMKVVSPLGQILGPKGLMPNPKSETVTKDVSSAVKNAKAGQVRFKSDKQGIVHCRIGQINQSKEEIKSNLQYLLSDLKKSKPPSSKGVFISKVSMSSTMGPGLEIDISSLNF